MRYLRAVTFVIGLSLIAVAIANLDSVIETKRIPQPPPDPGEWSYFEATVTTYNLLVPLIGISGLGLVSWAVLRMRSSKRSS